MKALSIGFVFCIIFLAGYAQSYDTAFMLNFNTAGDTAGWSDHNIPPSTIVTGETVAVDSPAYSPPPQTAPGANGTGWMRVGQAGGDFFGISLPIYDGSAGGATRDTAEFTVTADVFIVVDHPTLRNHQGLSVLWDTAIGNFPPQFFYSHNTPGQPNGYGVRGQITGGAVYGLFPAETSNRWVRMRVTVIGRTMTVRLDRERDGTYEFTSSHALDTTAPARGQVGFFSVINDPAAGNAGVPNRFAYFDNLDFRLGEVPVQNWEEY